MTDYASADCTGDVRRTFTVDGIATEPEEADSASCLKGSDEETWSYWGEWCDFSSATPRLRGELFQESSSCQGASVSYKNGVGYVADGQYCETFPNGGSGIIHCQQDNDDDDNGWGDGCEECCDSTNGCGCCNDGWMDFLPFPPFLLFLPLLIISAVFWLFKTPRGREMLARMRGGPAAQGQGVTTPQTNVPNPAYQTTPANVPIASATPAVGYGGAQTVAYGGGQAVPYGGGGGGTEMPVVAGTAMAVPAGAAAPLPVATATAMPVANTGRAAK